MEILTENPPIRLKNDRHLTLITIALLIVGLIIPLSGGAISENYYSFTGLLLIIGLASCVCGLLIGFLFGVPKFNKKYNPYEGYDIKHKYDSNTNLEEISDWLSKIIVGVTLTQITKIPGALMTIPTYVLKNNHCKFSCDYAAPIIIGALIYFWIAGFFIGFFYAKLWLAKLMKNEDELEETKMENITLLQGYQKGTSKAETGNIAWEKSYKNANDKPESEILHLEEDVELPEPENVKYLTDDEIEILRKILSKNNKLFVDRLFNFTEFSVINVLIKKGIIAVSQGDKLGIGSTLSIIDNQVKKYYSNHKKP